MKFIDTLDLKGKRVLFRFDYNVPLDGSGNITDDIRIRSTLPTINYALDEGAKLVIMSHLGRPKGKHDPKYSLAPVAKRLSRLLEKQVKMAGDCIGDDVRQLVAGMNPGDVVLLENLRFHPEEEKNDEAFARELATLGDVYIDDAFGNAHRSHASNVAITRFVPECGAGFLIKKELNYFQKVIDNPPRPFVFIVGGSKVSDKLAALSNLATKVDKMIVGGGMAFTFLKALGYSVGRSIVEDELIPKAEEILAMVKERGVKFYLPIDVVIAEEKSAEAETKIVPVQEMNSHWMGLDIGPATITLFAEALANAKTIVWNGPMGVFEIDAFGRGTAALAHSVANSYALTIVGGGDTDVAIHKTGESDKITYISTGGGASLELLEGKVLPGIAALEECGAATRYQA
ncbi:MAG: phosphoglycerate kinase [Deltaproteobacteria bacterium HGW-Deltaproteobacteria-19]|nr:MAG: phosphoglycerate kinase [Deltaproteobacteria bacterium HGW-Deltaproteobacteria-19]